MDELPLIDGKYSTKPNAVSWFSRAFPSLSYFSKFFWIVARSGGQAKWSHYDGDDWVRSSLDVLEALESVGVEFEITGVEHVERLQGPCVFFANHMSTLETCVIPCIVQPIRNTTFIIKPSLVDYPIFKHVMRSRDPIVVSQNNPRHDLKIVLQGGAERLNNGTSIIVFPQGVRTQSYHPDQFNSIAVKLAHRAGVPLVPLALKTDAWGLGSWIADFGKIDPTKRVHFAFGEPVHVNGRGADEHQAILKFIGDNLREWGHESPANDPRLRKSPVGRSAAGGRGS